MKFIIELTWSKVMALVVIILAFAIDIYMKQSGTVFMFSLPFVVFLITGKQFIDLKKNGKP
jgi:hypothetical protein